MKPVLIINARIVNEGKIFRGAVLLKDEYIHDIFPERPPENILSASTIIDAKNAYLLPGIIDTHVHFREPGYPQKGNLKSESLAAMAGGVTSIMDMPNTIPQTVTLKDIEQKNELASVKCLCNYAFFLGATPNNMEEIIHADPSKICGLKIFMGASTGQMLVDNPESLDEIFKKSKLPVVLHCENSSIIDQNLVEAKKFYGQHIPARAHTEIRSHKACIDATKLAIELALKHKRQTHILHVSTKAEALLLEKCPDFITAETAPHYLLFNQNDFDRLGNTIKCNPSVKSAEDQSFLLDSLKNDTIDSIATDHAPHESEVKNTDYLNAASGLPGIQFSLAAIYDLFILYNIGIEKVAEKMCHSPARIFSIDRRGYIRKGYFADITLFNPDMNTTVSASDIISKCGWSPYEGMSFHGKVTHTFVNGKLIYENNTFCGSINSKMLTFNRL